MIRCSFWAVLCFCLFLSGSTFASNILPSENAQCRPGFPLEYKIEIDQPTDEDVVSQYSVTGGRPDYDWNISCGSIDNNGFVTDIEGCCGTGSVMVFDSVGASDSIGIIFSLGYWKEDNSLKECVYEDCYTPYYHNIHVEESGRSKKESIVTVHCCLIESEIGDTGTCPPESTALYNIDGISDEFCTGSYAPYGGMWYSYTGEKYVNWYVHRYYDWVCY